MHSVACRDERCRLCLQQEGPGGPLPTAQGCAQVEPPAPSGSDQWSELEGVERDLLALEEELDPCAGHTFGQRGGKVQQDLRAVEVQHGRPARGEVQPSAQDNTVPARPDPREVR